MKRRHRRRIPLAAAIVAAGAIALATGVAPPAAAADSAADDMVVMTADLEARIRQMMVNFLDENDLPGIAMAVVTPDPAGTDPVITTFAAGYADLETKRPVDSSTQFELGSETKVFTADLLAYLVATGRVSLDDPLQDYAPSNVVVPAYRDPDTGDETPITLGDLATHQAGLNLYPPGYPSDDPASYTQDELWGAFTQPGVKPMWKPGTIWYYSNWGFGLLGTIVSNLLVEGTPSTDPPPFQDALEDTFLDALGMSSTMLEDDASPRLAVPYTSGHAKADYWNNTNALSGGGGLVSTADDMGRFVAAHLGYDADNTAHGVRTMVDTLLPQSLITQCGPGSPWTCGPPQFQMGLGWQLEPADYAGVGVPWATKDGGTAGTTTNTAIAPSLRVGATTMFNQEPGGNDDLAYSVLHLLVEHRDEPKPPADSGGRDDSPRRHELAESGVDAAALALPTGVGVMLMAAGLLVTGARRNRRSRPTR